MEDSNTMTIDFLRARLLSERTVSRTARQRANELAQRVAELEEQLRIVSIQRKKAEKATADVLSILENHGISDTSEEYYSSSDNDVTSRSMKKANGFAKEEESFVGSKQLGNESENSSCLKVDSFRVSGRSLSWKGRKDSSRSLEKYKEASIRRRSGFTSVGKPSKHRPGKSCRQIRQSEQRSEASDGISSSQQPNQSNDEVSSGEICRNSSDKRPEMLSDNIEFHKEKAQPQDPDSSLLQDERNAIAPPCDECNECGQETNMEEALEHQAQLIDQYEAMEKAQREWEEKFKQNSNNTLESCDPGNHSDVTEEADENPQVLQAPPAVTLPAAEANLDIGDTSITETSLEAPQMCYVPVSRANNGQSVSPNNQEVASKIVDVPDQPGGSRMPNTKGKHESLEFHNQPPPKTSSISQYPIHRDPPSEQAMCDPHFVANTSHRGESNALVPHGTAGTLAGVLDSLKQAKLMLQKQITRVPTLDNVPQRNTTLTDLCLLKPKPGNKVDIPGGLSGLFRLPSDFSLTTTSKVYVPPSGTQLSSAGHYTGNHVTVSSDDPSSRNHYLESNPSFRTDDRLISGQFFGVGPRTMSPNLGMNPYPDINVHANRPYPGVMMPGMMPSYNGSYRPVPASGSSAPAVSRLDPLVYNENLYTRSPVYRQ